MKSEKERYSSSMADCRSPTLECCGCHCCMPVSDAVCTSMLVAGSAQPSEPRAVSPIQPVCGSVSTTIWCDRAGIGLPLAWQSESISTTSRILLSRDVRGSLRLNQRKIYELTRKIASCDQICSRCNDVQISAPKCILTRSRTIHEKHM